jgi:phosphotransferase system  glucose/maltose/N-acetylglucosamine-specific IIC component
LYWLLILSFALAYLLEEWNVLEQILRGSTDEGYLLYSLVASNALPYLWSFLISPYFLFSLGCVYFHLYWLTFSFVFDFDKQKKENKQKADKTNKTKKSNNTTSLEKRKELL